MNSLALLEWIAWPQGLCKAGSLRNDLVSTLEPAESPEAKFDSVQIKKWFPVASSIPVVLYYLAFDVTFPLVVSFLWEMSNLVFCVWPEEKELESRLPLGAQTQWKEGLCLELVHLGITLPSPWWFRRVGTWGEDPEAKSLRDEREQMALYCQSFWILFALFILNFQEFDPRPSLSPGWRIGSPGWSLIRCWTPSFSRIQGKLICQLFPAAGGV